MLATVDQRAVYLEPFAGGCSVLARMAPQFRNVFASDLSLDLVLCWVAMQSGWTPPDEISEEKYRTLKHAEPSPLRGFAGYCCSFGGSWFNGYARNNSGDSYATQGARSCGKKNASMSGVSWRCGDFGMWTPRANWVIYADPPYGGVRGHRDTDDRAATFDHERFWETMRLWASLGASVFVSEYDAPSDWEAISEKETQATMAGATGAKQLEKLWVPCNH